MVNQLPGVDFAGVSTVFETIILDLRLPRVLAALFVGCSLSVSGAVMQGIFRNPLATPYILGVASGGTAGASLFVMLGIRGPYLLPGGALLGSLLAVSTVYVISLDRSGTSTYSLILAGVALSALFSAFTSFFIFMAGPVQQKRILFWLMGGFGRASWDLLKVLFPVAVIGSSLVMLWSREMNSLALGEEVAFHLGIDPESMKKILLGLATLVTSVSVAVAGSIGFVGLIVPHIIRLIIGPDHRKLIPASALAGGSFLILADIGAKTALQPAEIPVGIITALVGGPFFLYLLRRKIRSGEL